MFKVRLTKEVIHADGYAFWEREIELEFAPFPGLIISGDKPHVWGCTVKTVMCDYGEKLFWILTDTDNLTNEQYEPVTYYNAGWKASGRTYKA